MVYIVINIRLHGDKYFDGWQCRPIIGIAVQITTRAVPCVETNPEDQPVVLCWCIIIGIMCRCEDFVYTTKL